MRLGCCWAATRGNSNSTKRSMASSSHSDLAPRFYAFISQVGKLTHRQPKWHTQGLSGRKQNVNPGTRPTAKLVAQQQGGTQNDRLKKGAFTCWRKWKLDYTLWNSVWRFLSKAKISIPQDLAVPHLDIYPKGCHDNISVCYCCSVHNGIHLGVQQEMNR